MAETHREAKDDQGSIVADPTLSSGVTPGAAGSGPAVTVVGGTPPAKTAPLSVDPAPGQPAVTLAPAAAPTATASPRPAPQSTTPGLGADLRAATPAAGAGAATGSGATTPAGPGLMLESKIPDGLAGRVLDGRYTVLELLGSGGMSVVYLARHERLRKMVAVKVLRQELATSKDSLLRFHREAMAAASIGDPHIVDVTDYGFTETGDAYLIMERLEGNDLRHEISAVGAIEAGRAVSITRQILRALRAAHARGIIHRDLKADNVFLTKRDGFDFVKLLDFGISKITQPLDDAPVGSTGTGVVMGTPLYIAPEQAHGERDVDHRADIYSLGVILYEMLTGALPFAGKSALDLMLKHVQEQPTPPRMRRPDLNLPPELEAVVLKAMAKSPGARFQSAEEMLAALPDPKELPGGFSSGSLAAAPRPSRRWPVIAAASLVLVGGALVLLSLTGRSRVDRTPEGSARERVALDAARLAARGAPDARSSVASPVATQPDAAATPRLSNVRLEVDPLRAEILLGDELLGRGRAQRRLPLGQKVRFSIRAKGYRAKELRVTPDRPDLTYRVILESLGSRPAKVERANPPELKPNPYGSQR